MRFQCFSTSGFCHPDSYRDKPLAMIQSSNIRLWGLGSLLHACLTAQQAGLGEA